MGLIGERKEENTQVHQLRHIRQGGQPSIHSRHYCDDLVVEYIGVDCVSHEVDEITERVVATGNKVIHDNF